MSAVRTIVVVLLAVAGLLVAAGSRAQSRADVTVSLSADVVEVGEPFLVEMRAMAEGDPAISSPSLEVPPGMQASAPQISTRQMAHFGGGRSIVQKGIGATWQLVPTREGTFTIPPPTVIIDGRQVTAKGSLRMRVVAAGTQPRRRPRTPFGGLFRFPFGFGDDLLDDDEPTGDMSPQARELALEREPDPYVFVRLKADKSRAVIGEQVTLTYYVYYRTDLQLTVQREPALADFLRIELDRAPGTDDALLTTVAGRRYHVKQLDQVAIFPLRAGRLSTGVLTAAFRGRSFGNQELERVSNDVEIEVVEPPLEDRPLGYRLGDVGRFKLSATVTPRRIRAGETVAVEVKLTGHGNFPGSLKVPERTGVEWLDPVEREEIGARRGRVSGWRSFGYAVRIAEPGEVDLGSIELPFYDDARGRYDVAKVDLGTVEVTPAEAGANAGGEDEAGADSDEAFANLPPPRTELRDHRTAEDGGLDPKAFWTLLLLPPFGVALFGAASALGRRWRRRRESHKNDPAVLARRALGELSANKEPKDAAAVAERAVHLAVEGATGVRSRGVLLEELGDRLRERGLAEDLTAEVVAVLEACSVVRFDPDGAEDAAKSVVERTRPLVQRLARIGPVGEAA